MTKRKARRSPVTIRIADGRGGLRAVPDHRFAVGPWPIERELTDAEAPSWMAHMRAEADERNWMSHGYGELDRTENTGSLTIYMGEPADAPAVELFWEKPRGGRLRVRARANESAHSAGAEAFIKSIDARHRDRRLHREHRRIPITYQGLPWEGELWLAPDIRLGPPSRRAAMLTGPQVMLIDATVSGIGRLGVTDEFHRLVRQIKLVLGPVLGYPFDIEHQRYQDWVPEITGGQITGCQLRQVGYIELEKVDGMPTPGLLAPTALEQVHRPDLEVSAIRSGDRVVAPPTDLIDLWKAFSELPPESREQYLQACNCFATGYALWPGQRTAYATFLVVAVEALKPRGKVYEGANFYDVVNSLLGPHGPQVAAALKKLSLSPQRVRSEHLHRGALVADELLPRLLGDDFKDPSFEETLTQLTIAGRACLIEWLRCGGVYSLRWVPRPKGQGKRKGPPTRARSRSDTRSPRSHGRKS